MLTTIKFSRSKVWLMLSAMVLVMACSKELSEENGGAVIDPPPTGGGTDNGGTAAGSLIGNGGTCANFSVSGAYGIGLALDTSNKVTVSLNITTPGTYSLSSDTLNGIHFRGNGTAAAAGSLSIVMQGYGTPTKAGPYSFNVSWKGSNCSFQVFVYPVVPTGTGDYFPMTTNSNWTYRNNDPASPDSDTSLQVSTGKDATLPDGTLFKLFTTNYGSPVLDSSYYRKSGNNYHQIADVDVVGVSSDFLLDDFIFLKDDQPIGAKWETKLMEGPAATGGGTVKTKRIFEIIGKGVNAAVHEKVYTNVIKVRVVQVIQNTSGAFDTVFSYETWFAKGIGLINLAAPAPYFGYGLIKHQVF